MKVTCDINTYKDYYIDDYKKEIDNDNPMTIISSGTDSNFVYLIYKGKSIIVNANEIISAIRRCLV